MMTLASTRALLFATGCLLGWQLCSIAVQIASLTFCFLLVRLLSSNEQTRGVQGEGRRERIDIRDCHPGGQSSLDGLTNIQKSTAQHSGESRRNYHNVIEPEAEDSTDASCLKSWKHLHSSSPRETHSAHQLLNPMSRDERHLVLAWLQGVGRPELGELRAPSQTSAADRKAVLPLTAERLADHVASLKSGSTSCGIGFDAFSYFASSELNGSSPFTSVVPISSTISKEPRGAASAPPLLFRRARKTKSILFGTQPGSDLGADPNAHLLPDCSNESEIFTTSSLAESSLSRRTCAFHNELPALPSAKRTSKSLENPTYPIGQQSAFAFRGGDDKDEDIEDMAQVDQSTKLASPLLKNFVGNASLVGNNVPLTKLLTTTPRKNTLSPSPPHELHCHVSGPSIPRGRSVSTERLLDLITRLRE